MDHQSHKHNESASFDYPEKPFETPKTTLTPEGEELFGAKKVEEAATGQAIERATPTGASQVSSTTPLAADFPTNPLLDTPASSPTSKPVSPATSGLTAADNDLIEKAWVEKAKAIIAQTKTDPHRQNKEINKIKADYQKKRYNRDLKINVE